MISPSAMEEQKACCHVCGRTDSARLHHCPRCGAPMHMRKQQGVQRCLAFLIASIIAYIPANIWPIMTVTQLGQDEDNTILSGVAVFWEMHAYPVAITIFIASVLIPGLKILALAWLCAVAGGWLETDPKRATRIYWLTELVGRWSMVDVFVVAILVGLIQLGNLMSIRPGAAATAFGLMVILTMFAAHAFEPKLIWDRIREKNLSPARKSNPTP
ncbi:MAG: paraquat-inducible protein A [Verrucomicrobiales bacterium]